MTEHQPRILAFSGSSRKGSWNAMALNAVRASMASTGCAVTVVDLRDLALPIYDGDFEAEHGVPANARQLRDLVASHQGLLIASPEYNGSVSALLKNALDWCSRPVDGVEGLAPFRGKIAALVGASVSPFGGVRSLGHLRAILAKMGVHVLGDELLVPFASRAFGEDGQFVEPAVQKLAAALGSSLAQNVIKASSARHAD